MKKLIFVTLATATMGLVSCSSDEASTQNVTAQEEIQLAVKMENNAPAATRAAHNLQGTALADYTKAGIFAYLTGTTASASNYAGYSNLTVTTAADYEYNSILYKKLTPSTTMYSPVGGTNVDVYVYAPYDENHTDVTSMIFTVQDDQTLDANYIASDFVYGKATADCSSAGDRVAAVNMYHALTKLTFKIDDASNGTNASGITEIKLTDVYKKATINMSAAVADSEPWLNAGTNVTTSTSNDDKGEVVVSNLTNNENLYNNAKQEGTGGVSVIIPSQGGLSASAGGKVSVTIDSQTRSAYLGSDDLTVLLPGYEYVYTLNIKSQELVVAVSIKPWSEGNPQVRDLDF
jgi:hypothetical protein